MCACLPSIASTFDASRGWLVEFLLPLQQDLAKVSAPNTAHRTLRYATFQPMDSLHCWFGEIPGMPVSELAFMVLG